jgi:uncharacterized protein YjiS (DUF1127 family)
MSRTETLRHAVTTGLVQAALELSRALSVRLSDYRRAREAYAALLMMNDRQLADLGLDRVAVANTLDFLDERRL